MAEEQQEQKTQEQMDLDPNVRKLINVIALHIGSFNQNGRSGRLTFQVDFQRGKVPAEGFRQIIDEQVI